MVLHLLFLFTLLVLEIGENLHGCVFSPTSLTSSFFVPPSLCPSFLSTDPLCLLCTLWASKMICYSMSRFDLIPSAERLLIYNLSWRGTACVWRVCICNSSTRSPAAAGWELSAPLQQSCVSTCTLTQILCCTTDRACPPITFSMTTELHSGSNLHLSVMRTKSSSHLEIPALTTGWYKHLTSELCERTKECRLTSWQMPFGHDFHHGTGLKSYLIPKTCCVLGIKHEHFPLCSLFS